MARPLFRSGVSREEAETFMQAAVGNTTRGRHCPATSRTWSRPASPIARGASLMTRTGARARRAWESDWRKNGNRWTASPRGGISANQSGPTYRDDARSYSTVRRVARRAAYGGPCELRRCSFRLCDGCRTCMPTPHYPRRGVHRVSAESRDRSSGRRLGGRSTDT